MTSFGEAREAFQVRRVDGRLPHFFDVGGMTDRTEGEVIVDLEELRRGGPPRHQEDAPGRH